MPPNAVVSYFSDRARGNDWSRFQPMLSESKHFFTLTHLPVDTSGDWLRVAALLGAFEPVAKNLLCFMINKGGNEFAVVWPKALTQEEYKQVIDTFWSQTHHVWTNTRYEDQSSAYVCDPQVWFYENQLPLKE